jgi:hypothetical protein
MSLQDPVIPKNACHIQVMIGDRFKDYRGILLVPFELSMPCCWTILPTPMHTINRAKHTWKSSVGVELQKSCRVLSIGVTTQDFVRFWGNFFAFALLEMNEISQGFKNF